MGLDQTWLCDGEEFFYHRKFNALEGFMQTIWYEEGNTKEFNCECLSITTEILDRLEEQIDADGLEPTSGFFFGSTEKGDHYQKQVKALKESVIPEARKCLEANQEVDYSSWW